MEILRVTSHATLFFCRCYIFSPNYYFYYLCCVLSCFSFIFLLLLLFYNYVLLFPRFYGSLSLLNITFSVACNFFSSFLLLSLFLLHVTLCCSSVTCYPLLLFCFCYVLPIVAFLLLLLFSVTCYPVLPFCYCYFFCYMLPFIVFYYILPFIAFLLYFTLYCFLLLLHFLLHVTLYRFFATVTFSVTCYALLFFCYC